MQVLSGNRGAADQKSNLLACSRRDSIPWDRSGVLEEDANKIWHAGQQECSIVCDGASDWLCHRFHRFWYDRAGDLFQTRNANLHDRGGHLIIASWTEYALHDGSLLPQQKMALVLRAAARATNPLVLRPTTLTKSAHQPHSLNAPQF
jgi:hypothetical protein